MQNNKGGCESKESKHKLKFETIETGPQAKINACRETLNVKKILAEQESNTVYEEVDKSDKKDKLSDIIANLLSLDNYKITITLENK